MHLGFVVWIHHGHRKNTIPMHVLQGLLKNKWQLGSPFVGIVRLAMQIEGYKNVKSNELKYFVMWVFWG
jgi:hypothetical protein